MMQITPMVRNLLFINIGVFLVQYFIGVPMPDLFGLHHLDSSKFEIYQWITHFFVHANFSHILHNMLTLLFLAPLLERTLGSQRFLTFYMICGFGASVLYMSINFVEVRMLENKALEFVANPSPDALNSFIVKETPLGYETWTNPTAIYDFAQNTYAADPSNEEYISQAKELVTYYAQTTVDASKDSNLVGASGAVFGILMAFMLIFPNLEMMLLFIPFPIKAKYLIGAYALYEIYSLVQDRADDNVAHLAHLGGMLFAFILIKFWKIKQMM